LRRARPGLAAVLFACATVMAGDGGRLRSLGDAGDFRIAIFTEPEPLSAGPADVSVLVQDRESHDALLDVAVTLELYGPRGLTATVPAGPHARNRLFHGAAVEFSRGRWTVVARVRRGLAEAESRASFEVAAARPGASTPWPYLAVPPVAVALFAASRGLRRRERQRRSG
jgi:hypothetical protein